MNISNQHHILSQHPQKDYTFLPSERSKSPITKQVSTKDDRRVSPIKYPVYLTNTPLQQKNTISQQQMQQGKQNISVIDKENIKSTIDNKNNLLANQQTGNDLKINAIDKIIQNCSIMNLNSPTKQIHHQNLINQQTREKRVPTPAQNNFHSPRQTVENYQTFHNTQQQIQQQTPTTIQNSSQPISHQPSMVLLQNHPINFPSETCSVKDQLMCSNGDNKKAKYARLDNPKQVFCSKCSIVLVGLGVKMIDVQSQQNLRQKQLKGFIAEVNNLKNNILKELNSIQTQKNRMSTYLKDQKDQITKRYSEIARIFKEFQMKDIATLCQFQQQSIKKLSDFDFQFRKAWDRLELMVRDVSPNIQMIKVHISQQQFKQFMQDYHSQVKSICGRIDTFNTCCLDTKPFSIKKESFDRFNYDSISMLAKPSKNDLYFSFQRKVLNIEEQKVAQCQDIPQIKITSEQSWIKEQQPFRVLFAQQQGKEQIPSPTFKKL